jgi:hypothetical protein
MSGFTSGSAPTGWDNAYFQTPTPYTGTQVPDSFYNALAPAGSSGGPAWGDKLTKALGDLSKGSGGAGAAGGSGSGGGSGIGSMAPAQSGTGGGRAPSLDALVQLLAQRYTQLYPGGGSSKGLLGV